MVRRMTADLLPTLITVDELAAVLRCQPEKVYRLAAAHELPSYKIQGRRLFDESEVARWLQARRDGAPEMRAEQA